MEIMVQVVPVTVFSRWYFKKSDFYWHGLVLIEQQKKTQVFYIKSTSIKKYDSFDI